MSLSARIKDDQDWSTLSTSFVLYLTDLHEDEKNGGRPPALILTKEDILSIKRYERDGLNLPTTIEQVQQRLRFTRSTVAGLEPRDLLVTYLAINQHARSWSGIEGSITRHGVDIDTFARNFTDTGQRIINSIDRLSIIEQIELTVADITLDIIRSTPDAELTASDTRIVGRLAQILENFAASIRINEANAQALHNEIGLFLTTLQTVLIPDVKHKISVASNANLDQATRYLVEDIARLDEQIDEKTRQIKAIRDQRWWGLFGGLVGFAIADGITGNQAQAIRRDLDQLFELRRIKTEELNQLTPLIGLINELEQNLLNMDIRMAEAQTGVQNLHALWGILAYSITLSAQQMRTIDTRHDLLEFVEAFSRAMTPWREVGSITSHLLQIHRDALRDFNT